MVVGGGVIVPVSFVSSPWVSICFDDPGAGLMRERYHCEWTCDGG